MNSLRPKIFIVISVFVLVLVVALVVFISLFSDGSAQGSVERVAQAESDGHVQAVVSSHQLATEAGVEVLNAGGTAADAAVAVAAVLSVVEPWFSSALGGGTWALYYNAEEGEITSLDGVGPTGSKATVSDYRNRAGSPGMHQANVPGAWDGWMLWLDRYGRLDLGEVLTPSIRIAREGYPVSSSMDDWLNRQADVTLARSDSARIYAPNGEILREGDTVYQLDMADTFESLVSAYDQALDQGRDEALQAARDYFYRGPIAEAIVNFSDQHNGYLTLEDFHGFEAQIVDPISIDYKDDIEVFQNPPNSQGIVMLLALNILKGFDLSELGPDNSESVHLQTEAIKLAFSDRFYHVGDPDRVSVPVEGLLSEGHAQTQRDRISMNDAMHWPISDGFHSTDSDLSNTTTFHIVDRFGNGAAVTTSLGAQFFVVGDTGIHINHRMRFLALNDGDPNQVTPGYKVRHTSNPYMALKEGELYILGGNTGADTQSQAQTQQFLNIAEFGMTAQEAVGRPRFVSTAFPSTVFSYRVRNTLQVESDFSPALVEELRSRGHTVVVGEGTFGSGAVIVLDGSDDVQVGSEPRNNVSSGQIIHPEL